MESRFRKYIVFFALMILLSIWVLPNQVYQAKSNANALDPNTIYLPLILYVEPPVWLGPDGGSIVAIAVNPQNSSIVYAGTWGGGVFKTINGGSSWTFASRGLGVLYIDSLAVDPVDTNTIYAGTHGGGVYKSIDGGASWSAVNNGIQSRAVVYTLTVNQGNHSLVYAGTRGAPETNGPPWSGILYKSVNGGASWSSVLKDVGGSGAQDWVYSVRANPSSPNVILAATHEHGPYITNSYGGSGSWYPTGTLDDLSGRAVDFDPRGSKQTAFFATWHRTGMYKSTDGGYNWFLSNNGLTPAQIYPNGIAFEPGNPNTIYLASFADPLHGVMKSTNSGSSWYQVGLPNLYIYSVGTPAGSTNTIFAGTYSDGIYKSTNGGTNWSHVITGIINSQVTGLAFTGTGTAYGSTYNGGVFKSTDNGINWSEFSTNLGDRYVNGIVLHPTNKNLLFALTRSAGLKKYDLSTSGGWISASIPLVLSYNSQNFQAPAIDPFARNEPMQEMLGHTPYDEAANLATSISGNILSMAFAPSNSQVAFVGTSGSGIYKSSDSGTSWSFSGQTGETIRDIAIAPDNPNKVYTASSRGGIVRYTLNGGSNWGDLPSIPGNPSVVTIAIPAQNINYLNAGTNNGVWIYNGTSWSQSGLPGVQVNIIRQSPFSTSTIYAGTAAGAYILNNSMWLSVVNDLLGYSIQTIQFDAQNGRNYVFFGTTVRGTLRVPAIP